MDFLSLSLPEAVFLYMGLALQGLVRQSSLNLLPSLIMLAYGAILWGRAPLTRGGYLTLGGYLLASFLILALFWPEALPYAPQVGSVTVTPDQVGSYAASQDADAEIVTAHDTGQVPDGVQEGAVMARGYRVLLKAVVGFPLALARTMNSQAHRTFSSLMPMQWLLGVDLTTDITSAVADWVHNCYLPVQATTMEAQEGRTLEELLPWGDSPLRRGLATRTVGAGAQTGITWMRNANNGSAQVRCDVYLEAVEFRTQAWLFELKSPRGTPLLEVFQQELGLDAQQQARFLIYREMLRAAGPAVPAPSLAGTYAALRVGKIGAQALDSGSFTAAVGWLTGSFSLAKTLFSAARGSAHGLSSEFQKAIDGLSWLVGTAVLLTWIAPVIVGYVNLVLIGLFPIVVLWAMIPGAQFQPLALYFVALLFTSSAPLWWALIDLGQRLAGSVAPRSDDLILGLGNSVTAYAWSTATTVVGVFLVPLIVGMVYFVAFRALGNFWRSTTP